MNIALDMAGTSAAIPPPLTAPLYRLDRTFEQNAAAGPYFAGPYPDVPSTPMKDFLGYRVASRFGIAASLVLNERWFELYSRLGFDLLTYKTIRSRERRAHPPPNWLYLDEPNLADAARLSSAIGDLPATPLTATAAGSIGMPSSAPGSLAPRHSQLPGAVAARAGSHRVGRWHGRCRHQRGGVYCRLRRACGGGERMPGRRS